MSWSQWPPTNAPQPGIAQPAVLNPAPNVSSSTVPSSQYTPEQWAQMQHQNWQQWVQWQQQFQLWQQQYGAEYQKSMTAIAQAGTPAQTPSSFMNIPPPPAEVKPPPPPEEPLVQPTSTAFTMNVPPPITPSNYTTAPPPPVSNTNPTFDNKFPSNRNNPPPTNTNNFPQYDVNNQQKFNRNQNYNRGANTNWQNQNQNRNQPAFNRFSQPPPVRNENENKLEVGIKRPGINTPDNDHSKRNKVDTNEANKPEANPSTRWSGEAQPPKNTTDWETAPLAPSKNNTEELSEAEKKFDKQFHDWEAQFQKWKQQNANHPDKEQYREYEKKWETWRSQLLERREQMKRKRLGLSNTLNDKSQIKLELDRPLNAQFAQQEHKPEPVNPSDTSDAGIKIEGNKQREETDEVIPEVIQNAEKSLNVGFLRPPPNLNNQPLEFKKANESFGIELQNENNKAKSDADSCDFLKSNTSGGIPGLDLVKDSIETENKTDTLPVNAETPRPDLEAISRGINSILGDQKFLNMLSLVSQNQNPSFKPTPSLKAKSPKFSPTEYHEEEYEEYESEHLKFEQEEGHSNAYDQSSVNNLDPQNKLNVDEAWENNDRGKSGEFQNERIDPNRNFGQFGNNERSSFNRNIGNVSDNVDEFRGNDFERDNVHSKRDSFNYNKGFDNFSGRLGDSNRNSGNMRQANSTPFRPINDWNQGSDNGAASGNVYKNNLTSEPGHFNRGPESSKDNFSRPPPNFNRGPDNFNRGPDSFNRGPESFNRGPENFNKGPGSFNRGPDNFNRGSDNFNRGPDNFNRGPDNFNRGPDNFNRGPDSFNKGHVPFNRGTPNTGFQNFNSDRQAKGPNFGTGPNKFNQDCNTFNRNFSNFNEDANFEREKQENVPGNFSMFNKDVNFQKGGNLLNKEPPFARNLEKRPNDSTDDCNRFSNREFQPSGRDFQNSGRNTEDFNRRPDFNKAHMPRENFPSNFNNKVSSNMNFEGLDRSSNLFGKNPDDFMKGNFNADANRNKMINIRKDDVLMSTRNTEQPNFTEKDKLNIINSTPPSALPNAPAPSNIAQSGEPQTDESQPDQGMWKTKSVIDYDHKPLPTEDVEIILEPLHTFDYRHKPLNRIPYPSRPKWLTEMISNYPEFGLANSRNSRAMDYRSYPPKNRFESSYNKYDDRGRKSYDERNRRPLDDFDRDRKPYEDRSRKVLDDKERRNYDNRGRKMFDDKERRGYDDRDRKFYEDKSKTNEENVKLDNKINVDYQEQRSFKSDKLFDSNFDDFEDQELDFDNEDKFEDQKVEESNKQYSGNTEQISTAPAKSNVMLIEDILSPPGRFTRPPRIVIILRGPPGSGKSFLAKLIKDKEVENGGSAPRILCLDDYFMVEQEKEVEEDGRLVKVKELVYEHEEEMEGIYRQSLMKSFKKTITDGYFNFIVVDNVNDKVKYFGEMWSFAKQNGFQVYICQMELDVQICTKRNIHGRSESEIEKCVAGWEHTPSHHPIMDATSLIQFGSIPEVEMEEINSPSSENQNEEERLIASKWDNFDYSVDNLAKLDGTNKPLRPNRTMEDYLQLDDDWIQPVSSKPGQKRVRWADLEERKQQEKMRAIGFVVGQTNWDRMMDPTMGSSALTQTKYIERYSKY